MFRQIANFFTFVEILKILFVNRLCLKIECNGVGTALLWADSGSLKIVDNQE